MVSRKGSSQGGGKECRLQIYPGFGLAVLTATIRGPEAGGGGAFSAMRLCSGGGQSQPQVEPKQPPAQSVQGGIPMGFPQQNRPGSQIYQPRPTSRLPQRPMISGLQTPNVQYQSTAPTMVLHAPYTPLIIPHPNIQPGRNQSHGGGQGGGSGGAPPATFFSSQQQLFPMPSQFLHQYPSGPYLYPQQLRNTSFGAPNSGPHPGAPSQPPPQQQPQQFVVDPNVTGSGGGGGPGGGSATVLMQHPPPQQAQPQPRRRRNALPITDPNTGRNIMDDLYQVNPPESGDSSSSATPQPSQNGQLAAEFAARVAAVAADREVPGPTSSGVSGTVNGPSTPPPQQPPPPVSAVEVNLPPSVHPPSSTTTAQNQRSSDLGPSPQPQPQPQLPQPQQCLNQSPVIQTSTVQPHHPAVQPHPQHHLQHHQQAQIPPQQIPTVSAKTDSPTVELPRPKAPTTAHSPGRKSTPVPPVQPPVLDQKKKDKKVTGLGSTLTPHREEPEEVRKSSFAESINIKNLQPTPVPIATQLPPQQAQLTPPEPETNGEPELPPPNATAAPLTSQTTSKHHERQEQQHQTQHERGGKALQRQKQKKKASLKELNRRGQEKEGGTDMDAFTSSTPAEVSPPSPPASSSPGPVLTAAAVPVVQPAASQPEPAVVEISPPQTAPLSSQPAPEPRQASPAPLQQTPAPLPQPPPQPQAPVSQTIIPPPANKNVDIEQDEGLEDMDEEEEVDEDSLLVAQKNEENAKAFLAPTAELDERIVIQTTVIERSKAPSLKYTYKEGQWSPLNPEGKKVYDREFLLNLRTDDLSTKRPDIDDCDIIKTDSTNNNNSISATNNNRRTLHGSNSMSMNRGDGFAPTFMRSSSSQRGGGMPYSKRGSQQGRPGGGGGGGGRSKGMYPSSQYKTEAEEELHWASKGGGWKPERCKTPPKLTEDELKTENLYKRVRGILNKLTPQKFEKLMEQIIELPIDTHERLKGVVELVFDKAVDEPSFSRAYAKLCQNLGKLVIKEGNESNDSTSFRKILLTRCQQMFEKKKKEETGEEGKKSDDERIAELQKQVAGEENKEKKKELHLILEEEERKIRVKYVGLARFIGELFKLNMLTANIMHGCIKTLLEKIEEESLECLCKLLTTVGKELETQSQKENKDLEEYFVKMKKLSQKSANSKVSSRVRFMLQDVIELRSNKWVPRRDENNPKTMEQIQKDAERETMMESALLQSSTPRSKHSDRDDRRRGGPRGGGNNNSQDPDGWHVSTNKFRNFTFEPSKLQHLKGMDNEPAGGLSLGSYGQFSQWNSGSNAKRSGGDPKRPEYSNKFALLGTDDKKMAPPMMSRKATPSSSLEKERAVQGVREVLGDRVNRGQSSNPPSRDSSRVRGKPGTTTPQAQTPVAEPEQPVPREVPPMNPEACKKKSRELFDEWFLNRNVQETVDSIKESFSDPMLFVKPVLETVLEGKQSQRVAFGDLLALLMAKDVITAADFSRELTECIEMGEDLMIDLPFVWTYLAHVLVPIFSKGVFTFADLKIACESCRTPYLSKTLAELISQMLKSKGPGFIRTQWESSKVKFSDFIPETDVDNFIKEHNFGFLIGEGEIEASEPVLPMNEVEKALYEFLIQDGEKVFDHVCEWVKANVGAKSQDVDFIRSLTRAVITACIKNEKIVPGSLNKHSTLIKKFVDANETRELACLSGIQHLIVVQMMSPAGVLVEIFQTLYENGIISHEAFIKWKTSKNEEGKGVALACLSSFFVSLSEQDDSDDEST